MRKARETSPVCSAGPGRVPARVPANDNDPFDPPPAASLRAPRPLTTDILNYTLAEAA